MTLSAAPPISLEAIRVEFGRALPCVFPVDFYGKGGAPVTGALSFGDFLGRSAVMVNAPNAVVSAPNTSSSTAASYELRNDGTTWQHVNGVDTQLVNWLVVGAPGDYEVLASHTGNATGAFGVWRALSIARAWGLTSTSGTFASDTVSLQLRKVGTTDILDTATINLSASSSSGTVGGGGVDGGGGPSPGGTLPGG